MTYRGEDEALRARVTSLEQELDAAKSEIASLRGATPAHAPETTIEHSRVSGGPSRYVREVVLPYTISERGYERIAEVLRSRLGLSPAQVGGTLTVPRAFALSREEASTRIRLEADWRSLAGGVISSTILASGFGGLASAGIVADALIAHGTPLVVGAGLVAAAMAALGSGAGWLMRRRTARGATEKLALYEGTFAAILSIAEEHAIRQAPPTRVAGEVAEGEGDGEGADEALGAREGARAKLGA